LNHSEQPGLFGSLALVSAKQPIHQFLGIVQPHLSTFVYRNMWISVYNLCTRRLQSLFVDIVENYGSVIHKLSTEKATLQSTVRYAEKENA
jgi:hypothetical protein